MSTPSKICITPMQPEHWPAVEEIYRQGIETGMATFETDPPTWDVFDKKFMHTGRMVAIENNMVTGWIALVQVSQRACYRGIAEVSVYIRKDHWRKGIGKMLLNSATIETEKDGYWSLLSVIHEENIASIHLHEQCGYRIIGYREKIACLNGKWKTTVMMEKRSNTIGV
jgi:phosphinothricin acetyltransferase